MPVLRWLLVLPPLLASIYAGVIFHILIIREVIGLCGTQHQSALACLALATATSLRAAHARVIDP